MLEPSLTVGLLPRFAGWSTPRPPSSRGSSIQMESRQRNTGWPRSATPTSQRATYFANGLTRSIDSLKSASAGASVAPFW